MAIAAADLLASSEMMDGPTRLILNVVAFFDMLGAREWDLRTVGVVSCLTLYTIKHVFGNKGNVDWAPLLHNIFTGLGSTGAVYLDFYSAELLTGTPEPLRSCLCEGPLTSIHRIIPAISMGYGVMDMIEGFKLGPEFVAHGIATFLSMAVFVECNLPQVVVPFLLMENSSIFLCLCKATFLSPTVLVVVQLIFAFNFFLFRIVITPFIWFRLVKLMYEHSGNELYQSCFNPFVLPFSILFGMFFHCLNAFWFYKILRKIKRKVFGKKGSKAHKEERHPVYDDEPEDKENIHAQANVVVPLNGQRMNGALTAKKNT